MKWVDFMSGMGGGRTIIPIRTITCIIHPIMSRLLRILTSGDPIGYGWTVGWIGGWSQYYYILDNPYNAH